MFFHRHSAAVFAPDLRPDPLGEDRPGQPAQIASQVVQAAQVVRNRVSVAVNDEKQVLCRFWTRGLWRIESNAFEQKVRAQRS